jgi:NitT/TauT family transport system ATP-binding protein
MSHQSLVFSDVSFGFEGRPTVVDRAHWRVDAGEFHCLLGRSGCGKTTLLQLAAGLLTPQSGQILWHGESLKQPKDDVGFVFQSPTLLHWLSVLDNVLLPIRVHRACTREEHDRATALLHQMGLSAFLQQRPTQLSGGQQSRVAIARALITQPALLLMDEPFASLDALTREELQSDLRQWVKQAGASVLFVTHDLAEAVFLADRVALMDAGRIVHEQTLAWPERNAALRYSALFAQRCASLRAALDSTGGKA